MPSFNDYFANMGQNALSGALSTRDALNERRDIQNRQMLQGQLPTLINQYGAQNSSLIGQNPQQAEANKKYLSLLASTDPEGALKYIMDMQRGGAGNSVELLRINSMKEAEPIANQIDALATENINLNKTDLQGNNPEVQDKITKNNESIALLSNKYKGMTSRDHVSPVLTYAKQLNDFRKEKFGETKDVGDIESKIVKEVLAQGQKSVDLANQVINAWNYMTSGSLDFTNPADVRKVIVGFNKLLEPNSAVMADDFKTTVGIDDASKLQNIANGMKRIDAGIRGFFGGEQSKSVNENSDVQYLVNAQDARKVYQSVLDMKPIVDQFITTTKGSLANTAKAYYNKHYEEIGAMPPNNDVILKSSGLRTLNGSVPSPKYPSDSKSPIKDEIKKKINQNQSTPNSPKTLSGSKKGR